MPKDARWLDSTPTQGKRRFGRKKVIVQGCECGYNYSCGACMDAHVAQMRVERDALPLSAQG